MGALEATAWALRVAEHELGVTPVLSAQAVVAGSDPLGLIAYLSHFHSAFKNTTPNSSGELEGRWAGEQEGGGGQLYEGPGADSQTLPAGLVSQSPGTPSAILFLGKLQRSLQRTRAKVRSLSKVEAGGGVPSEVPGMIENTLRGGESRAQVMFTVRGLIAGPQGGRW